MYALTPENITLEISQGKRIGKICRLRIKSPTFKNAEDSERVGYLLTLG